MNRVDKHGSIRKLKRPKRMDIWPSASASRSLVAGQQAAVAAGLGIPRCRRNGGLLHCRPGASGPGACADGHCIWQLGLGHAYMPKNGMARWQLQGEHRPRCLRISQPQDQHRGGQRSLGTAIASSTQGPSQPTGHPPRPSRTQHSQGKHNQLGLSHQDFVFVNTVHGRRDDVNDT